ncbi:hypothetical protein TrCOL_g11725 [Triparma columacea]|uniref:Aromatic amino acid beta-eliminating lyase/threonine aldolase domain-containing protein n=1 Tax=Triparma columacea TaxID=722753 RepID=A0A9W7G8C0_9STRA|nr:hypothetical protein TrCOL_g11725 [Triparma columacea]
MMSAIMKAPVGDDVLNEDPTIIELETKLAKMFGKSSGLFFPTGTMSNLCGIMAHCHGRGSEIILGRSSHLCLYEHGNLSTLGSIHSRQIRENDDATLPIDEIIKSIREDDPHYPRTDVVAIENTHNVLGGVPIPKSYVDALGTKLASEHALPLHIDGARIFNACVALNTSPKDLCENASSVSICLSKGLGSPVGSVLVGSEELIYRARRQRKACGGGMRQAGVIAAAGIYAIENNVERLAEDHQKAMYLSKVLSKAGYIVNREPETNLFFFGLPDDSKTSLDEIVGEAEKQGILFGGGYSGGTQCRLAAHKDVSMEDIEEAARVISELIK